MSANAKDELDDLVHVYAHMYMYPYEHIAVYSYVRVPVRARVRVHAVHRVAQRGPTSVDTRILANLLIHRAEGPSGAPQNGTFGRSQNGIHFGS